MPEWQIPRLAWIPAFAGMTRWRVNVSAGWYYIRVNG
jgi:hypothetical protein